MLGVVDRALAPHPVRAALAASALNRPPKDSARVMVSRRTARPSRTGPGPAASAPRSACASGTSTIWVPDRPTIVPERPAAAASKAATPKRVASTRSIGHRRAAALDVAEDRHARLVAGAALDLLLEQHADAAEAGVAEGVGRRRLRAPAACPRAGVAPSATTTIEKLRPRAWRARRWAHDVVDVERPLGHEDRVGAAGDARRGWRSSRRGGPSPPPPSRGRGTRRSCAGGRSRRSRSAPRSGSRT